MKPRPVIALALPRAVGVESEAELADVELTSEPSPGELAARLPAQLPAGFELIAAEPAVGQAGRVARARGQYLIEVAGDIDWDRRRSSATWPPTRRS